MKVQSTPGIQVRLEVWKSLFAVLRSYCGLAQVNGGSEIAVHPDRAELLLDVVFIESRHARISLNLDPPSGKGVWTMREIVGATEPQTLKRLGIERLGKFQLAEDGTLLMGDKSVELDIAAINWIEKLASCERVMEAETSR